MQGYYYTEPSGTLYWGAPATALGVGVFLFLWCIVVVSSSDTSPTSIPYDTLVRLSPRVDVLKEPAKELRAIKKNGEEVVYKLYRVPLLGFKESRNLYQTDQDAPSPWRGQG